MAALFSFTTLQSPNLRSDSLQNHPCHVASLSYGNRIRRYTMTKPTEQRVNWEGMERTILSGECNTREVMSYLKARYPRSMAMVQHLQAATLRSPTGEVAQRFRQADCDELAKILEQPILAQAIDLHINVDRDVHLQLQVDPRDTGANRMAGLQFKKPKV